MIRVVCCYCKKQVRTKPATADAVSHGVCDECLPDLVRDMGVPMMNFLDALSPPVLVVQDNARVIAANASARKFLSKEQLEICGDLPGEVLGCMHADEPGGCGQTIHCKSCAIRQAVTETMETGERRRKTAFADIGLLSNDRRPQFLIETEKVNRFVRLTIHPLNPAAS